MLEITSKSVAAIIHEPSEISFEEDFVAIAVSLYNGEASHCGLVVNYNKKPHLFHFDFDNNIKNEELKTINKIYYLNKLPIIKKDEVPAFLTKCELIFEKEEDLEFGFFYAGEFYDEDNNLIFKVPNNNITNCVFFCISIISGFLVSEKYFEFNDWNEDNIAKEWFHTVFLRQRRKEQLTKEELEQFWGNVRRIPPIDYFSSAEIVALPIRKVQVDKYSKLVTQILAEKFQKRKEGGIANS